MEHHFDIDIATKYGIEEAIIIHNLIFWITKNKANKTNGYDGYYWTYNSSIALSQIFPYMSSKKISRILLELESKGIIKSGKYNTIKYDQTKRYTISQKEIFDCSILSNEEDNTVQPIPYNNTYINKDHSLTSIEVNSYIDNITTSSYININDDIVELNNKTHIEDNKIVKEKKKKCAVVKSFDDNFLIEKYNNSIMKLIIKYLKKDYIKQSFDNDKVLDLYEYIKDKTMQSIKLVDNNTGKVKMQDLCNLLETMFVYYEDKGASNIKNCFNTFYNNFNKSNK